MKKIRYKQAFGITYEQELEVLAEVYRLALESCRKRKQTAPGMDSTPAAPATQKEIKK